MADNTHKHENHSDRSTEEAALAARLARLGAQLGQTERGQSAERAPGAQPTTDPSAMARGFRLSTELVAGVLVGAAIGWALDYWLGISPWGLIVFLLLGFAAGVFNVMRAAGVMAPNSLGDPDQDK
jgi:ATP synthase protein I